MNWNIIVEKMFFIAISFIYYRFIFYLFIYVLIYFQRRCMHALRTKIVILWQNVKMRNVFVKEIELETGKTAEVPLIINTDLIEGKINEDYC